MYQYFGNSIVLVLQKSWHSDVLVFLAYWNFENTNTLEYIKLKCITTTDVLEFLTYQKFRNFDVLVFPKSHIFGIPKISDLWKFKHIGIPNIFEFQKFQWIGISEIPMNKNFRNSDKS